MLSKKSQDILDVSAAAHMHPNRKRGKLMMLESEHLLRKSLLNQSKEKRQHGIGIQNKMCCQIGKTFKD